MLLQQQHLRMPERPASRRRRLSQSCWSSALLLLILLLSKLLPDLNNQAAYPTNTTHSLQRLQLICAPSLQRRCATTAAAAAAGLCTQRTCTQTHMVRHTGPPVCVHTCTRVRLLLLGAKTSPPSYLASSKFSTRSGTSVVVNPAGQQTARQSTAHGSAVGQSKRGSPIDKAASQL